MKNLKLTNLEKMNQEEMTQVRGGLFGMGKLYIKIGSHGLCIGHCATVGNQTTGRKDHGNKDRG